MHIHGIDINWVSEPSVWIGLPLWTITYFLAVNRVRRRFRWGPSVPLSRQVAFHLGTLIAGIALLSPLDTLADEYLFSAHMVQHLLLMFVAAPLWLLGIPGWLVNNLLPYRRARRVLGQLTQPVTAFLIFNGIMWIWHLPAAYDAALQHEWLHIIEHLMFIGAAILGWWPVLGPDFDKRPAISHAAKFGYLVASLFGCTALAVLITLAERPLYTFYGSAPQVMGVTPLADQQIGGALMWVPVDMLYVALIGWAFYRWLDLSDPQRMYGRSERGEP